MSYTALYRKYRPLRFDEMVGQAHITKTLKNQIMANRIGHAYLFNGGRGTGKTSAAKVFARAVNCLHPQDGEPCNECEICKAALEGSLTDIVEMDAASNNSVEDIRSIRDEVNFLPTLAKYRVYIIDEVHMLSTGAFNALLKTLEEPPAHVKFILATTEPQKLPATILSRCQRFDFKKISNEDIAKRLAYVCKEAGIAIEENALKVISVLAEGAMRDGLSILERCAQEGNDTAIDEALVKELVGIPKLAYIHAILENIVKQEVVPTLQVIEQVLEEGKDIQNFLWELIKYVKDVLLYKATKQLDIYNEEEIKQIEEIAKQVTEEQLLQMIYALSELENDMKWSSQRTILFQVGMMKLCRGSERASGDGSGLQKKVEKLEQQIAKLSTGVIHNAVPNVDNRVPKSSQTANTMRNTAGPTAKVPINTPPAGPKSEAWSRVMTELKQSGKIMLYTNLINSQAVEINDMTIGIQFPGGLTPFGRTILEKDENRNELRRLVSMEYGKDMLVKIIEKQEVQQEVRNPVENMVGELDIPVQIMDE